VEHLVNDGDATFPHGSLVEIHWQDARLVREMASAALNWWRVMLPPEI